MQGPLPRPTPLSQSPFAACVLMFGVQLFYTCCPLGQELLIYSSAISDLHVQMIFRMNGKQGSVIPCREELAGVGCFQPWRQWACFVGGFPSNLYEGQLMVMLVLDTVLQMGRQSLRTPTKRQTQDFVLGVSDIWTCCEGSLGCFHRIPHYDALSSAEELRDLHSTEWNGLGTVSGDLEGDS